MRLTLLGTQGWVPGVVRETTCFAVSDGDELFVFDAGTGLGRLVTSPWRSLVEPCAVVRLFLTHYHLDHVCGLAYLPAAFPGRRVVVYAPAAAVTGVDPHEALDGLLNPPYNPHSWREWPDVELRTLDEGASVIAGHRLRTRAQVHSDTSVAYRLDDALVVATDTVSDPGTVDFAAGAEVLLHEAWYLGRELERDGVPTSLPAGYDAHSEALAVARLALAAGVGRLVFIHLNPLHDEAYNAAMAAAARDVFAAVDVLEDGTAIDLAAKPPD